MSHQTENAQDPNVTRVDRTFAFVEKLRQIPCLGFAMAVASGVCFTTASFTVELMRGDSGDGVDASIVVTGRSLVQFAFYLPVALLLGDPLFGVDGERLVLFQRSVFGSACFLLNYYSLAYVSISDASSIAFSAPVFVSLFACLLLREPCTPFQILTIITALIGVTMIARPAFLFPNDDLDRHFHRDERFVGTILSFATSLSMAYTFVLMRRLQKTPVSTVITYFSLFCIVAGALTAVLLNQIPDYTLHVPYDRRDYYLMLANGLCGVMGQAFLVISLKIELAGLVSLARTFDIVIAFLYQVTLLNQSATQMSIIGAAIVLISCAACACKKLTEAKPHLLPKFMSCMR